MSIIRVPRQGEFYRHFKNKLYQIVAIAEHSETREQMVIYQALYDDFKIYARPLSMFVSEVDHDKYPEISQHYRFELVDLNNNKEKIQNIIKVEAVEEKIEEQKQMDNFSLYDFLDARTYEEKREIFIAMKKNITSKTINDIAVSLDVVIEDADLDSQYNSLMNCLNTMVRYECTRFR